MARYFFHLMNSHGAVISDTEGEEFAHDDAAREHGIEVARELARNKRPTISGSCYILVLDERGGIVDKLRLGSNMPYQGVLRLVEGGPRGLTDDTLLRSPVAARIAAIWRRSS